MKQLWLMLVILTLLIAACGVKEPNSDAEWADSPLVQPTSPVSVPPTPQLPRAVEDAAITALRALIAEKLQIAPAELMLVSAEQVTWRDASLGCPQPGQMYAQVLTPGWRVVFADAAGHEYDVHTPENPELFVICTPAAAQPWSAYQDNPAVEAAIKALVEREGVALESISVVTVESVEWSNSCLGCARQGERCLMVITPGYRIVLKSGEKTYTLHTNRSGGRAILCDHPESTPPRTDS